MIEMGMSDPKFRFTVAQQQFPRKHWCPVFLLSISIVIFLVVESSQVLMAGKNRSILVAFISTKSTGDETHNVFDLEELLTAMLAHGSSIEQVQNAMAAIDRLPKKRDTRTDITYREDVPLLVTRARFLAPRERGNYEVAMHRIKIGLGLGVLLF